MRNGPKFNRSEILLCMRASAAMMRGAQHDKAAYAYQARLLDEAAGELAQDNEPLIDFDGRLAEVETALNRVLA